MGPCLRPNNADRIDHRPAGAILKVAGPVVITLAAVLSVQSATGATPTESVLFPFPGGSSASEPLSGVIEDSAGNFYGTTFYGGASDFGTVYVLTPPKVAGKPYRLTLLYQFLGGTDGDYPQGGLVFDAAGDLVGTTLHGGSYASPSSDGDGTVFRLLPPAPGTTTWTKQELYSFGAPGDGADPIETVLLNASGAIFGTTNLGGLNGDGTVFELAPPVAGQTDWTETVLYTFQGGLDGAYPFSPLIFGSDGGLLGTTSGGGTFSGGTAFELSPPGPSGAWQEQVLYVFGATNDGSQPVGGLLADSAGDYYGTCSYGGVGNGTVFELSPPSVADARWTERLLHVFTRSGRQGENPQAGLIADPSGNLYGTTFFGGALDAGLVYELTADAAHPSQFKETVLYSFRNQGDGAFSDSALLLTPTGQLVGTTPDTSAAPAFRRPGQAARIQPRQKSHHGTAFAVTP